MPFSGSSIVNWATLYLCEYFLSSLSTSTSSVVTDVTTPANTTHSPRRKAHGEDPPAQVQACAVSAKQHKINAVRIRELILLDIRASQWTLFRRTSNHKVPLNRT